jgi:hypothetical protein
MSAPTKETPEPNPRTVLQQKELVVFGIFGLCECLRREKLDENGRRNVWADGCPSQMTPYLKEHFCSLHGERFVRREVLSDSMQEERLEAGFDDYTKFLVTTDDGTQLETVCPRCHACLGCQKLLAWRDRSFGEQFWCKDCWLTHSIGSKHLACHCCDIGYTMPF